MANMVSNYNAARSLVDSVGSLFGALGFILDPIAGVAVAAGVVLYNYFTAGTIADFAGASTDATLLANMKCSIYNAIKTVGYVDATNFAAMVAAIGAIPYAHADVISALVDYCNALGLLGFQQLQVLGATFVGACTGCSAPTGCSVPVTSVIGTGVTWDGSAPSAGVMVHPGAAGYAGVVFAAQPNNVDWQLRATADGTNDMYVGMFTGTLGHGGPSDGDNLWVNDVTYALVYESGSGAWFFVINGSVVVSGSLVGQPTIRISYEHSTGIIRTWVGPIEVAVHTDSVGVAWKPVAWLYQNGSTASQVLICSGLGP